MIENYLELIGYCTDIALVVARDSLSSLLPQCTDKVLSDFLEEVEGGYLIEDEYIFSRLAEDEIELRKAKKLLGV